MTKIKVTLAAAAALMLVLGFGGAASAQYPPTGAQCAQTLDSDGDPAAVFDQGERMEVAGDIGCADPGANVDVDLESAPIEFCDDTAGASGSYSCTDTIPSNMPAGEHDVVVTTVVGGQSETYRNIITVVAAGATLPATGTDIALLALWAVGLVVFGSLLVSATWKHFRGMRLQAVVDRDSARIPTVDVPSDFEVRSSTWTDRPTETPPADEPSPVAVAEPEANPEPVKPSTERITDVVSRLKEEIKAWEQR